VKILAIGNSTNLEVDSYEAVRKHVQRLGGEMVLFQQDHCLKGAYLNFSTEEQNCKYVIETGGAQFAVDEFDAIWQIKPMLPEELLRYPDAEHRAYIHRQFKDLRESIWNLFADKFPLNNPHVMMRSENKPLQMATALKVGLNVPRTEVTSNPDRVRNLYKEKNGKIIVKTLSFSPILDHVLYTNLVNQKMMDDIDTVKFAPSIFQEMVEKDYELRLTIVGEQVFACKIDSQASDVTSLDWRKEASLIDYSVNMDSTVIPEKIHVKIIQFMRAMGLVFGCIDLIVDKRGEYVFLEINPNGQWWFVQQRTNVDIAKSIANKLMGQ
jgi:glutathione synthase/RimK-type ligase-like ATP-grasp enzyme